MEPICVEAAGALNYYCYSDYSYSCFQKPLDQNLPKAQALQKVRLSYMLAYSKISFSFFARLPLTMPAPHQPGPELKRGTTLVEAISVEAAGALDY